MGTIIYNYQKEYFKNFINFVDYQWILLKEKVVLDHKANFTSSHCQIMHFLMQNSAFRRVPFNLDHINQINFAFNSYMDMNSKGIGC